MDFVLKVTWSGDCMDQKLINQLLALPGEELHLKKGELNKILNYNLDLIKIN